MQGEDWVLPDLPGSLSDLAREYDGWLRSNGMYHGGVVDTFYADPPAYEQVIRYAATSDSAIWTGTYLAAEAWRLSATGSEDARANVIDLVRTLHLWFNVLGQPGLLARYAAPVGQHSLVDAWDCADSRIHCNVEFEGVHYDVKGEVSRDQYQGVMLGYAAAYEALGPEDEATRSLIREDVIELIDELMKERELPVLVTYNGLSSPFPISARVRFTVVNALEMENGLAHVSIDSNDTGESFVNGIQEFMPDVALLVRQVNGMGWVPSIYRAGSAVMLASFFRVALLVTDGVPGFADKYAEMRSFYASHDSEWGNVNDWLDSADTWSYLHPCGDKYYSINIVMEPMENLARLEDDPVVRARVVSILESRLWREVRDGKNSFFSYIYAAHAPFFDPQVVAAANAQLAGFGPPPRVKTPRDLRGDPRYLPHDADCPDQTSHDNAVDVADRVVASFIWQKCPWDLYDPGDATAAYPGIDFLAAYWLARRYGFLSDEHPSRCLAWR